MAVTRINNNQITDAVGGNTQFGINANTKVQPYSVTSTLLANNLTYGSDLTITGNLSIQGNVTAIDTTNVTIEDPLLLLASTQSGAPAVDIGYIGQRGTSNNIASVWDESSQAFVTVYTDSTSGNTTINILSYADFITGNANVTGTLTAANISFTGNVLSNLNVNGTIFAGNVSTIGYVSAGGNVTGNYLIGDGALISNINAANVSATKITNGTSQANLISSGGNLDITINNNLAGTFYDTGLNVNGTISSTGNVVANEVYGNHLYDSSLGNYQIVYAYGANIGQLQTSSSLAFTGGGATLSVGVPISAGNITGNNFLANAVSSAGNIVAFGDVNGNNIFATTEISAGGNVTAANFTTTGNITGANVIGATTLSASGTVYGNTGSFTSITATGNIGSGSFLFGDGYFISNINAGNVSSTKIFNGATYANIASADGNLVIAAGANSNIVATFYNQGVDFAVDVSVQGRIYTGNEISAFGNILTSGNFSATGNITGGDVYTDGNVSALGTVYGSKFLGNSVSVLGNVTSDHVFANTVSSSGNVKADNCVNTSNISLSGNVISALNVTGNVEGQNFITTGIISSTGTATVGNVTTGGNVSATGNITGGNVYSLGEASASGNVYGANVFATTNVSAGGNVNVTGNINANTLSGNSVAIWSSAGGLDLQLAGNGNVNLNTAYINNLQSPVQASDAATKQYVDDVAQGLNVQDSTQAATPGNLATISSGAVSYNNGNAGVGANLVTTGTYTNIDGVAINTVGTRILVKDEANTAHNGIYTYSNATVLVRATDYNSVPEVEAGDFVFNLQGTEYGNTGWVQTSNTVTIGTGPIVFTQFSGAGSYTAGNAIAINGTVISAEFDNSTIGINGSNQLIIPANAPLTTPNIGDATGSSLSVTGSITGNVINGSSMSITGNVIAGNVTTGNLSLTGNVLGNVNVDNILSANVLVATSYISTAGNVYGANISSANIYDTNVGSGQMIFGNADSSGLLSSASTLTTDGNNVIAGGNISAGGFISAAGNITAANFTTTGASGNITGANVIGANILSASGNVFGGNLLTAGYASATGNIITGNFFIGDGAYISNINAANVSSAKISNGGSYANITTLDGNLVIAVGSTSNITATFYDTGVVISGNIDTNASINANQLSLLGNVVSNLNVSTDVTANNIYSIANVSAGGNVISLNVSTGSVSATGNVWSGGELSATGNVIAGNVTTVGLISATGSATAGNVYTAGEVSATGNITGGNISATGNINTTGNIVAGYFYGDGSNITGLTTSAARISNGTSNVDIFTANGNVSFGVNGFGNVFTVSEFGASTTGNLIATGDVGANNVSANTVTGTTSGTFGNVTITTSAINTNLSPLTINSGLAANDFAVNGQSANVLYVNATTNSVSIGSNVQTTGAALAINATNSLLLPVGNTAQRPGTPVEGMIRYNTTISTLEAWDGATWEPVGSPTFTVIQNEQFNGDGSTVAFTLGSSQTTDSCLVTINGVVQIPTTAYSVAGVDPTCVLTFTEAPQVSDVIDVREITTTASVTSISNGSGNAVVTPNSSSANVDITGNLVVDSGTGFIYADGTYLTNVGGGNVIATRIQSGNSQVNIAGPGGNVYMAVGNANVFTITPTQATFTGNVNPSSNATQSLGNATNQWSNLWISGNTIFIGGANLAANGNAISYNGSPLVAATSSGNIDTSGVISAGGNVIGSNLLTTNIVSATGNVTGGNLTTGGLVVATGNLVGGNITTVGLVSATGNITGGNISATNHTGTTVSVTGNVTGASLVGTIATAAQPTITSTGTLTSLSVSGNVTGGNVTTTGTISVGGITLSGNLIVGVGPTLTIDPNGSGGTDGNVVITGNLTVQGTTTTINSNTISTDDLTINMANNAANATAANNGGIEVGPVGSPYATLLFNNASNVWVASLGISSVGNVTGGNLSGTNLTGSLATAAQANITSVGTLTSLSVSGNVTGGNVSVGTGTVTVGNIVNGNGNTVGNIGSSSLYFNTVFAQATSALYADLAEKYVGDADYAPGTVVSFGGEFEVTASTENGDPRVAGVVSTNPSYIMNGGLDGANVITVALTGRVPTRVTGTVRKGDLMVSNGDGTARAEADPRAGAIIGKALADFDGETGIIEVVIGAK